MIRLIVRTDDAGIAAEMGGDVHVSYRTVDAMIPSLEDLLERDASPRTLIRTAVVGAEIVDDAEAADPALESAYDALLNDPKGGLVSVEPRQLAATARLLVADNTGCGPRGAAVLRLLTAALHAGAIASPGARATQPKVYDDVLNTAISAIAISGGADSRRSIDAGAFGHCLHRAIAAAEAGDEADMPIEARIQR